MSSEEELRTDRIEIPTFIDPNLFWIVKEKHVDGIRNKIDYSLNVTSIVKHKVSPQVGQIVCIQHQGKFKRAIIKDVKLSENKIVCWLLDYGILHVVSEVYLIPSEVGNPRPVAKRASLYNVLALHPVIDDLLKVSYKTSFTYNQGIISQCNEHLSKTKKIFFYLERIMNDVLCGYIKLENKIGQQYNLTDVLIHASCISVDPKLYSQTFQVDREGFSKEFLFTLDSLDPKSELEFLRKLYPADDLFTDSRQPPRQMKQEEGTSIQLTELFEKFKTSSIKSNEESRTIENASICTETEIVVPKSRGRGLTAITFAKYGQDLNLPRGRSSMDDNGSIDGNKVNKGDKTYEMSYLKDETWEDTKDVNSKINESKALSADAKNETIDENLWNDVKSPDGRHKLTAPPPEFMQQAASIGRYKNTRYNTRVPVSPTEEFKHVSGVASSSSSSCSAGRGIKYKFSDKDNIFHSAYESNRDESDVLHSCYEDVIEDSSNVDQEVVDNKDFWAHQRSPTGDQKLSAPPAGTSFSAHNRGGSRNKGHKRSRRFRKRNKRSSQSTSVSGCSSLHSDSYTETNNSFSNKEHSAQFSSKSSSNNFEDSSSDFRTTPTQNFKSTGNRKQFYNNKTEQKNKHSSKDFQQNSNNLDCISNNSKQTRNEPKKSSGVSEKSSSTSDMPSVTRASKQASNASIKNLNAPKLTANVPDKKTSNVPNETSNASKKLLNASSQTANASKTNLNGSNEASIASAQISNCSSKIANSYKSILKASKYNSKASKDKSKASKDTSKASKDTSEASKDTSKACKDTSKASKDTSKASKETLNIYQGTSNSSQETSKISNEALSTKATSNESQESSKKSVDTSSESKSSTNILEKLKKSRNSIEKIRNSNDELSYNNNSFSDSSFNTSASDLKLHDLSLDKNNSLTDSKTESLSDIKDRKSDINEDEESVNELPNQPHVLKLGCKCSSCKMWDVRGAMEDVKQLEFIDSEKKKPKVEAKSIEKPDLLFQVEQPKSEEDHPKKIGSFTEVVSNIKRRVTANNVLIHGNPIPEPCETLSKAPFNASVYRCLHYHKIDTAKPLQSCVWPAIMRKQSIFMVGSELSGKTMAYVPAVASWILDKADLYKQLPTLEKGPIVIVICSGVAEAEEIYERFVTVKPRLEKLKIVTPPVAANFTGLWDGCNVLVTTPITLMYLIKQNIVNFKRLCHLIIENAHVVLDKYKKEITSVLKLTQSMLVNRKCRYTVQLIVSAENWTVSQDSLLRSLHNPPLVCIAHALEAAVYGRTHFQPHFLEAPKKMDELIAILKDKYMLYKTIVICNTDEETQYIKERLQVNGIALVTVNDEMKMTEITEQQNAWENALGGKRFVLVCTHAALTTNMTTINSANLVVHYSLPKDSWSSLKRRFTCILANQLSPLEQYDHKSLKSRVHMFIDETCQTQFPRLLAFLERIGVSFPDKFYTMKNSYAKSDDELKIQKKVLLCSKLKMFGSCNKMRCHYRHTISPQLDENPKLPKSGTIHFKILHIHDMALYTVKLLRHIQTDGTEVIIKDRIDYISKKLSNSLRRNPEIVDVAKVGNMYAYPVDNGVFQRVTVLQLLKKHIDSITKKPTKVRVKFVDLGKKQDVLVAELYEIPDDLKNETPQGIDVILANILPPEKDESFSMRALTIFKNMLNDKRYSTDEAYFSAQIALQVGSDIWVDNVRVNEKLDMTNITVNRLDVKKCIQEKNIACFDEEPLQKLYELCKNGGFNLPNYDYLKVKPAPVGEGIKNTAKPSWAFLDAEDFTEVHLTSVVSPSMFYVTLSKFSDLFERLQGEMQVIMNKPLYPEIGKIEVGTYCLANYKNSGEYLRACVLQVLEREADCFFVDLGDVDRVLLDDVKYLADEFITRLPFQAIECSLYGVKPLPEEQEWSQESVNMLIHYRYEPGTDFYRELFTKVFFVNNADTTGGKKYCVALIDTFQKRTYINQMLIDGGVADNIGSENLKAAIPDVNELLLEFWFQDAEEEDDDGDEDLPSKSEDSPTELKDCLKMFKDIAKQTDKASKKYTEDILTHEDRQSNDESEEYINGFITKEELLKRLADIDNWEYVGDMSGQTTETIAQQEAKKTLISRDTVEQPALPPSTSKTKYYTPQVLWFETNEVVKLNIKVVVDNPVVKVIRNKTFIFQAVYNEKEYQLKLPLLKPVKSQVQYTAGQSVRVTLIKEEAGEWHKLTSGKHKYRNIIFDVTQIPEDKEKKRLFLQLDSDEEYERKKRESALKDDSDGDFIEEFYSDVDYSESDFDSLHSD